MKVCGFVDTRNNFLAEDGTNIISGVGLLIFFVDLNSNVLIFHLVDFQVKYFALDFSQIGQRNVISQCIQQLLQVGFERERINFFFEFIQLAE